MLILMTSLSGSIEATTSHGLTEWLTGYRPGETALLRDSHLSMEGWLNLGVTFNASGHRDGFNGPVTFTDRANTLQLNQLYLSLERAINFSAESWAIGGRIDFLFGTDALFAQTHGSVKGRWDNDLSLTGDYGLALPQTYLEVRIPFRQGVNIKLGHFYAMTGAESVMAPDNFFASHTYMMQFGEPFTHTGLLATYPLTADVTLNIGTATGSEVGGWDGAFDGRLDLWAFLGGLTYTNTDGSTSTSLNALQGESRNEGNVNLYSLVVHHDLIERWHYTLQQDYGWSDGVSGSGSAEWYGMAHYLSFDLIDSLAMGIRAEWFRDDEGNRVTASYRAAFAEPDRPLNDSVYPPAGHGFYDLSVGLRWKPVNWITIRPGIRYDWTDQGPLFDCKWGRCQQNDQFLFTTDLLISL